MKFSSLVNGANFKYFRNISVEHIKKDRVELMNINYELGIFKKREFNLK